MKNSIGVIFGGRSVEHEISIVSALQVMSVLSKNGYQVIPLYLTVDGNWLTGEKLTKLEDFKPLTKVEGQGIWVDLQRGKFYRKTWCGSRALHIDLLFPVIHGTYGEDGTLQGLLELINMPYIGCDVAASAVGMDKILTKKLLRACEIPILDFLWFSQARWLKEKENLLKEIEAVFKFPLVVKPGILGSSIGISIVKNREELEDGIDLAASLSGKILIEPQIIHLREFNCSVLGEDDEILVSECEEPLKTEEILSYTDKYSGGKAKIAGKNTSIKAGGMAQSCRKLPADISLELKEQIQDYARHAFYAMGGSGVARVDFMLDEENKRLYLGEINTIPGSLAFYLWEASGITFDDLIARLVKLAKNRFLRKNGVTNHYANNIFG